MPIARQIPAVSKFEMVKNLTLYDLGGISPLVYSNIYTSFGICRRPLRFSKFNFLSFINETKTIF